MGSWGSEDATWHLGTVRHQVRASPTFSTSEIKESDSSKFIGMKIINFDANKAEWKEFLTKQVEEHPQFFKTPQSFEGQEYFKTILELIAKRSMQFESVMGLWKFINAVQNEYVRSQMWTWLEKYTPIRHNSKENIGNQILVVRDYRSKCSLVEGKEHPYYSLKPQPRKHFQGRGSRPVTGLEKESELENEATRAAVSELDFQKKITKIKLNKFLNDRSIENRRELIAAINAIPLGSGEKKGAPFLQGGAVGSRR